MAINRIFTRLELHRSTGMKLCRTTQGATVCQVKAFARDISSGGIGIVSPCSLSLGEVVRIDYPFGDGTVILPIYSEVVWSSAKAEGCWAGLRFLV